MLRTSTTHPLARLLIVACAFVVGITIAPATALADPPVLPDTASEAAQQVSELQHDLEILSEEQNEARVVLDQHIAEAASARASLDQVNSTLAVLDEGVRGVARSAFSGDRLGSFSAMLTSGSPQEFLDRVNTLSVISVHNNQLLDEANRARVEAETLQLNADASVSAAQAMVADIEARKAALESQISTYRGLYAQLSAAEQALVSDGAPVEQAAAEPAAAPSGSVPAPTAAAQAAVDAAYAQLGDRYVYGAGGPDAFDCSGLTMYAYAQAGVSLPHSSSSQSRMGVAVGRDQLQPGDLVFYYSPVSHVGIYVGNGQIIHASNESRPVQLAPVGVWGAYNSARRIV